jgi:cytochrome P450
VFYHLCANPHTQKRAQEELDRVIGDRDIEYADLDNLKYIDGIIKESLRLNPPSGGSISRAPVKDIKYKDYTIPKGTMVFFSAQMDAVKDEQFPNAREFKPERWESSTHSPFAYLPFGKGARSCLGQLR